MPPKRFWPDGVVEHFKGLEGRGKGGATDGELFKLKAAGSDPVEPLALGGPDRGGDRMADTDALREELRSLGFDRPMEGFHSGVAVQNRIVVVSGFRGSGKTTVAARILQRQPRVIVL